MKHKVVLIEWIDAVTEQGWQKATDLIEAPTCLTMGFLVKETKLSISVAATISDDEVNAIQTIPRSMVVRKKYVKIK